MKLVFNFEYQNKTVQKIKFQMNIVAKSLTKYYQIEIQKYKKMLYTMTKWV